MASHLLHHRLTGARGAARLDRIGVGKPHAGRRAARQRRQIESFELLEDVLELVTDPQRLLRSNCARNVDDIRSISVIAGRSSGTMTIVFGKVPSLD
jgi:hypothetical protein